MMMSIIGNFSSADTPLVGSSSSSSFGRTVSAIAMSSSLRTPPGSSTTRPVAVLGQAEALQQRLGALPPHAARRAGCQKLKCASWQAPATSMLSSTDSSPNSCGIWNERATPRPAMARGCSAVMSRPSKWMWPASGLR